MACVVDDVATSCLLFYIYILLKGPDYQSIFLSQNIPPFKHLYEALLEYTLPLRIDPPLLNIYMRPSQNVPLPLRIYPPPFKHLGSICDPPRIYPSIPDTTRFL